MVGLAESVFLKPQQLTHDECVKATETLGLHRHRRQTNVLELSKLRNLEEFWDC